MEDTAILANFFSYLTSSAGLGAFPVLEHKDNLVWSFSRKGNETSECLYVISLQTLFLSTKSIWERERVIESMSQQGSKVKGEPCWTVRWAHSRPSLCRFGIWRPPCIWMTRRFAFSVSGQYVNDADAAFGRRSAKGDPFFCVELSFYSSYVFCTVALDKWRTLPFFGRTWEIWQWYDWSRMAPDGGSCGNSVL